MSDLRTQLTAIYRDRGELTPDVVVAAATPKAHPLHSRFEWDDAVAGHEYRKVQAAELIRSVKVTYSETPAGEAKRVRAFTSTMAEGGRPVYRPTKEVLQDEFSRNLLLRELQREMDRMKQRYGHLEEFARIVTDAVA